MVISNPRGSMRSRRVLWALSAMLMLSPGCVLVTGDLNPFSRAPQPLKEHVVLGEGKQKILLVDLNRVITHEAERGPLGILSRPSVVERLESELDRAAEDDAIRAVVVRINSPGGTVTASESVYSTLRRFQAERDVPVIAQLMDMATSGGFYAAIGADEIVAHPTTVTGSVGVVFYNVTVAGLLEKIGVRDQTVKTGSKKDIGSPLRVMTDEERELLEGILDEMQQRFLARVRERRPSVSDEAAERIADGRILSAGEALRLGLVDRIADLRETIEELRRRIGDADARVVVYRRPTESADSLYSQPTAAVAALDLLRLDFPAVFGRPQFLYLWMPAAH